MAVAKSSEIAAQIESLLAQFPDKQRAALDTTRERLHELLPTAVEDMSWGMPTLRINNVIVVSLLGFKEHNSLFPGPEAIMLMGDKIGEYTTTKGTIHFDKEKAPSRAFLKALVAACIQSINGRYPKKSGEYLEFYANGVLKEKGKLRDGERVGTWQSFTQDGKQAEFALSNTNMDSQHAAARAHLTAASPVFVELIACHEPEPLIAREPREYFEVLVQSIVGQQVSVKAAASINARLFGSFTTLTPETVSKASIEHLREQGLSQSKASYVLGLSEAFRDGVVNPHELAELPDEEVLATLTQLKGIGPWTAEMFLMFAMGRPDVWSMGDLGLRKAVWALFGEEADFGELTETWRPFRTYAALYLWEHADNPPNQS